MIIELLVPGAGPLPQTIILESTQVKIRQQNGTMIAIAAEVPGMRDAQLVAKVGDDDFQKVLRQLGINEVVDVQRLDVDSNRIRA